MTRFADIRAIRALIVMAFAAGCTAASLSGAFAAYVFQAPVA